MFEDYKYQIFFNNYNCVNPPTHSSIYSKSIDDVYDYMESRYSKIIIKEEWKISRTYDFDFNGEINALYSKFYNIDCFIKLIETNTIEELINFYKCVNQDKKDNFNKITIKSLYVVKIPETNLIEIIEFENKFIKYQNKYLNLLDNIYIERSEEQLVWIQDTENLKHIIVDKKIVWFLENHFRHKTLDNSIVLTNIKNKNDFVLNLDNFAFDNDTNIIISLYGIFFL
jgi:hypothetical protein